LRDAPNCCAGWPSRLVTAQRRRNLRCCACGGLDDTPLVGVSRPVSDPCDLKSIGGSQAPLARSRVTPESVMVQG
jgi:hypothetical protein